MTSDELESGALKASGSWRVRMLRAAVRLGRLRETSWGGLAVASATAGLMSILILVAGARWWMPSSLDGPLGDAGWTARQRAWFTTAGVHPPEQADERRFSWTGQEARLTVPHLDRSQAHRLTFRVAVPRPADQGPPARLDIFVDRAVVLTHETSHEYEQVSVTIPSARAEGAVVHLRASYAFVPGPHDRRVLGFIVDNITIEPESGHFRPSRAIVARTGFASSLFAAGIFLCGGRRWAGLVSATFGVAVGWLLLQDGAFLGPYIERLTTLAGGSAAVGALAGVLRARWPAVAGLREWPTAAALTLGAGALKLAFFIHPLITVGDGIFQIHRARLVRAGEYFFTSVTPRPFFEFPYAVGLYVSALPLWRFFPSDLDQVRLLRGLALGADALVGLAFYAAVRRQWNDRTAALLVAAMWPFARAPVQALCNANLTNVFAQGLFGVGMAGLVWAATPRLQLAALAAACAVLTGAYLSHFSTLSVGIPLVAAVGLTLVVAGVPHVRRAGIGALVVGLIAVALSYAVYYSHFNDIYRGTVERVLSVEHDVAAGSSIAASPAVKFDRWWGETSDDYGLPGTPLFAAAAVGAVALFSQRRRDGLTLVLLSWAVVWGGMTALGILTSIQMRVNIAAAPLFVCLGAYGLATLRRYSRAGVAMAAALAFLIVWSGARLWPACLGLAAP